MLFTFLFLPLSLCFIQSSIHPFMKLLDTRSSLPSVNFSLIHIPMISWSLYFFFNIHDHFPIMLSQAQQDSWLSICDLHICFSGSEHSSSSNKPITNFTSRTCTPFTDTLFEDSTLVIVPLPYCVVHWAPGIFICTSFPILTNVGV